MLRRKVLYPEWKLLQIWFEAKPRTIEALSHLAVQGHVCRHAERPGMDRFEFRHDRILEHLLSLAAFRLLENGEADREVINDPFFVGILGQSIVRPDTNHSSLEWVGANMPVALFASLPYLSPGRSAHSERIVSLARDWLGSADRSGLQSMFYDARSFLVATHSCHVLEATVQADADFLVALARLRNGDALAGVNAVLRDECYPPSARDVEFGLVISQALHHHRSKLILDVGAVLRADALPDKFRSGAACARGLLRRPKAGRGRKDRMAEDMRQNPDASCRAMGWASLRRRRSGIGVGPDVRSAPARFR